MFEVMTNLDLNAWLGEGGLSRRATANSFLPGGRGFGCG